MKPMSTGDLMRHLQALRLTVPGGCEQCEAYQSFKASGYEHVHLIVTHHDPQCPTYQQHLRASSGEDTTKGMKS